MPARVLLDECVPRQLKAELAEFVVQTAPEMGWAGVKNGALLELAAPEFDVLFTVDRDFAGSPAQSGSAIALVILEAGTTDPIRLRPHLPAVVAAIQAARPGTVTRVGV